MSSDKKPVDLELKKAFQELQVKMISTSQQLKVSDLQIEQLKKQITHSQLVGRDLETLPSEASCYKSIGRMFLKMPLTEIKDGMRKEIKEHEEKIKNIEGTKSYLERTLKESEENLREMVIAKQREQIR